MAETFRIEIVATTRPAEAGIARVDDQLERLNRTAESTNGLLRGALQVAGITSAAVVIQRAAAGLREYADEYTQVQNQLAIVTRGTRELEETTTALLGVANRSRTGFEETSKLYARTALATRELGTSQQELLGITETVNKAIILSGASAKEANNGLIQLSQAIASNRLAGDELRSVLEQLPVVADVIAKQIGVTRGELRELGRDGEITAKVIIDAFQNAREEIEGRFAKTVPTVSQGFQILRNDLVVFIGELNKATGASQFLANALAGLGKHLKDVLFLVVALGAALAVGPIARYVQGVVEAAAAQQALNEAFAAGLVQGPLLGADAERIAAAQYQAAVAATVRTKAEIEAIEAQQLSAVVSANGTRAALAQAEADVVAAAAATQSAQARFRVAQAELQAQLFTDNAVVATAALVQSDIALTTQSNLLAAAQERLAATTLAVTEAEAAQAAVRQQVSALNARLVTQSDEVAAAHKNLAAATAAPLGPLGKLAAFISANPYGAAAVAIGALTVAVLDFREGLAIVSTGLSFFSELLLDTVALIRETAAAVPGLGAGLTRIIALVGSVGLGFAAFAATNPFGQIALAVGALVLAFGSLKRSLDDIVDANEAVADSAAIAPIGQEIVAIQQFIKSAQGQIAKGNKDAIEQVARLQERLKELAELAKQRQGIGKAGRQTVTAFDKELKQLQEEAALLGKSNREREIGLELIRIQKRIEREGKTKVTPEQSKQLADQLRANQLLEDEAEIIKMVRGEAEQFAIDILAVDRAFEKGLITVGEYNQAMLQLERRNLANSPFAKSIGELTAEFARLSLSVPELLTRAGTQSAGGDPAGQLKDLQAANREREVQNRLAQELNTLRDKGIELTPDQTKQLADLIRTNAELERQNELQEQRLQLQRDLADEASVALLPDFDRNIQEQVLALRELNLTATDEAARSAEIRRNAALNELGGILNGLQSPTLALAQQQGQVARQIELANEQFREGNLTLSQYSTLLDELNFRAQQLSTTFSDGLAVAIQEMSASITEATVAQTALTSAVNATGSATAEFVQNGTVDFRRLALNVIAEITKIITQMLVLRAISAASGFFGGGAAPIQESGVGIGGIPLRAEGGSVKANKPYIVGEKGPELMFPGQSGTVVSNDRLVEAMARSGAAPATQVAAPQVTVPVSIVNVSDPNELGDYIDSPEGGRKIMNQVSRNPETLRRSAGR